MVEPTPTAPLQNAVLCQIGLVVKDADRIAAKLSKVTGVKASEPTVTDDFEKARTQFRGSPSPAKARLIFFDMGQVAIEIIEPIGGPSTWREFLDRHGDGVHHIAFTVNSADQGASGLAAGGIPVVQSGVFEGGKYVYLEGEKELGVILELLEFSKV
jgi:catechol 2,3-dioxygenase-like lactoylglutathione lyase family enzyme